VVTFKEAAVTCQECKGTGQEPLTNLPCLSCGGIGAVKKEEEVYMGQAGKKAEKLVTNPENPE
jgi:DnaJ-class molecular chaperone